MKKIILSLVAIVAFAFVASAANYTIDEQSIDTMIECATESTPIVLDAVSEGITDPTIKIASGAEPIIAFVLAIIPVTGWLAIHRMYLGTSPLAVILNIITGGGFGIVYVVDWVVLLLGVIDGGVGQYVNNPRWWMWANII